MSGVMKAMLACMEELNKTGIGKDRTNERQKFKYRGVDEVMNALAPLLVKHRLLILPKMLEHHATEHQSREGNPLFSALVKAEYKFLSVDDGSAEIIGPFYGEGMDSADKATNKAMSIAYKYACIQAFCIPTEGDNDPDATVHNVAPKAPPEPPPAPIQQNWDGSKRVGFSKNYRNSPWRDTPDDFVAWCCDNTNKLNPYQRESALLEQSRRKAVGDSLDKEDLPESFYAQAPQ